MELTFGLAVFALIGLAFALSANYLSKHKD